MPRAWIRPWQQGLASWSERGLKTAGSSGGPSTYNDCPGRERLAVFQRHILSVHAADHSYRYVGPPFESHRAQSALSVSFAVKAELPKEVHQQLYDNFLALQDKCVRHGSQEPYIINLRGGKQISPEGKHRDMQYVFVMDFEVSCVQVGRG